jgi:hypothetical protein
MLASSILLAPATNVTRILAVLALLVLAVEYPLAVDMRLNVNGTAPDGVEVA